MKPTAIGALHAKPPARHPWMRPSPEACPACSGVGRPLGTSLGSWVFECSDCELWFLAAAVRPQADRENHWYATMTEMTERELADLTQQMAGPYRWQLKYLGMLTSGRDLLDVGCGIGMFLREARRSWNAFGLEASDYGRAFARTRLGLRVEETLDDLPVRQFDVVRLSHVMEHIPEPRNFVTWISTLLKPGGVLTLIVPNREPLVYWVLNRLARLKAPDPVLRTAIYPNMHVLGFSERSLINVIERNEAQLSVLSMHTVSMGDPRYYPLLYDGLLRVKRISEIPRQSILRYYVPLLLANLGNPLGLGDWIVAYFRKHTLSERAQT